MDPDIESIFQNKVICNWEGFTYIALRKRFDKGILNWQKDLKAKYNFTKQTQLVHDG